jgi:hypothetical protein
MKKLSSFRTFVEESKPKKSLFDSSINVVYLYNDDFQYEIYKPLFDEMGHGAAIIEKRLIIMDGESIRKERMSRDEIEFIEAHEYSHIKLGESATEADCDWLAIANLWKKGRKSAAKVGVDSFVDRHNMEFETDDLPGYDVWIGKSRKLSEDMMTECEKKDIDILSVLKNPEKFYKSLDTLDELTAGEIVRHGWDLYITKITGK